MSRGHVRETAEYLAGRGFVVATAPLVGTHTALVKLDVEDLDASARSRARHRAPPGNSRSSIRSASASWVSDQGGMAGVAAAMRNRDVRRVRQPGLR
jgi:dienelactone hydrolase